MQDNEWDISANAAETRAVDATTYAKGFGLEAIKIDGTDFIASYNTIKKKKSLYNVIQRHNDIYSKDEMTDEDGERVGDLEAQYAEMDGYNLEADAEKMLSELGISNDLFAFLMNLIVTKYTHRSRILTIL